MIRSASGLARRFALGLAGESMQSAFHFAVNLVLIRTLAPYDYGLFSFVFTLGSLGLTYAYAVAATPASVIMPKLLSPGAVHFQEVVFGAAAFALALASALLVGAGLALAASAWVAAAGGLFVGGWTLRTYLRGAFFARREPARAAASDLAFSLSGIIATGWLVMNPPAAAEGRLGAAFLVLAGANLLGILVALAVSRRPVKLSFRRSIRRRYRVHAGMIGWSLASVTTVTVQSQSQSFLIPLIAGPAAFAPIAASVVLMAPLRLATMALISMVQPDFAAALHKGQVGRARTLLFGCFGLVLLGAATYGGLIWLAWGLLSHNLYGPQFADAPMAFITALAWGAALAFLCYMLPKALLEAAGEFRVVATGTAISAVAGCIAVLVLLLTVAPEYALVGVLVAEGVAVIQFWLAASRVLRSREV